MIHPTVGSPHGQPIGPVVSRVVMLLTILCWSSGVGCATVPESGKATWKAPDASVNAQSVVTHHANLTVKAAEAAEQKGQIDEAIRLYEQARGMDPRWNTLCRRLAVLYDRRGEDAQAHAAYDQALALQPDNADLLNDFGVFHLQRERWADAEAWFRQTLAIQPQHERAAVNLGVSVAMQGRLHESYDLFSQVVGPAAAYSNLGVLLARQGRAEEAREHLRRAQQLDYRLQPASELLASLDRRSAASSEPTVDTSVQPASYVAGQ